MNSFNPIDQRCVPILGRDEEVSLVDLFTRADELPGLGGDSPTMTAALYRLALAVLHRALGPVNGDAWTQIWQARKFPVEKIVDYLERWRHRFDLFGDEPFYQCRELATAEPKSAALLVPYKSSGNNVTLFDHTTSDVRVTLTPAEAFRWLVTVHAFDLGGTKTPGVSPDKSSTAAPCARGAVFLVRGATVFESLMLNLPAYEPGRRRPMGTSTRDAPVWERPQLSAMPRKAAVPRGWTDLLTWQSRRVWLRRTQDEDGSVAIGEVVICPGDSLHKDFQLSNVDQHMAFYSDNVTPLRIDRERALWRSANALAARSGALAPRGGVPPRTFGWLLETQKAAGLKLPQLIPVTAYGLVNKQSKLITWAAEDIVLPARLLDPAETEAAAVLESALRAAEEVGSLLFEQARRLRGEFKTRIELQEEKKKDWRPVQLASYWAALTPEYDRLAHHLAGGEYEEAKRSWSRAVEVAATSALNRMLATGTTSTRNLAIRAKVASTVTFRLREALAGLKASPGATA
ncbi:type I-E CRISPR-associated protein Cse1/CasA [Streptosporangium sp. NPDC023963]|uniref:type I-E CRISPR-associated protein Cse1/CasA n=1 Tax=Streptosporangium sp. NPDC023963 TaxID=3155608 RepID=UPI003433FD21